MLAHSSTVINVRRIGFGVIGADGMLFPNLHKALPIETSQYMLLKLVQNSTPTLFFTSCFYCKKLLLFFSSDSYRMTAIIGYYFDMSYFLYALTCLRKQMSFSSTIKEKINWKKVAFITGVVLLVAGALDPLEGSVVILIGSALIAFSTWHTKDRHYKLFLTGFIMIVTGVCFLFYLSSLGGFGGSSSLSWWWGLLIVPYPAGWLLSIILLIIRAFKKRHLQTDI